MIALVGGCLAIPHLDQLSPQVRGTVVDAATSTPVSDARVEFVEYPSMTVLTDDKGQFVMRETRKPELFVPLLGGEGFNIGAKVAPRVRVTREGYETLEFDASNPTLWEHGREDAPQPSSHGPFILRPIALTRAAQ